RQIGKGFPCTAFHGNRETAQLPLIRINLKTLYCKIIGIVYKNSLLFSFFSSLFIYHSRENRRDEQIVIIKKINHNKTNNPINND
ncbi:UNVERIFIED_CONTAM: hypothetical protein NY100_27130, partial [Prevotella sp. 15_C9]